MTINVKMDLIDITSVVETIKDVFICTDITKDTEYYEQLKGALLAYRDALEEESLRYANNSYEAFEITNVILKIDSILKEGNYGKQ